MNAAGKESFPEANLTLKAPPGSEGLVYDLSVHRTEQGFISRWHPTDEERAAIAAGGPVWVSVLSKGGPPPIAVFGASPFHFQEESPSPSGPSEEEIRRFLQSLERT